MATDQLTDRERDWLEECAMHRAVLRDELTAALAAVRAAAGAVEELSGKRLYDVEYAEGTQGRDLDDFLGDAARALRAAVAINNLCDPPEPAKLA